MTTPTPRQLEALLMIYRGKRADDRDPDRTHDRFARNFSRNTGGAVHRMVERMCDAGWLEWRELRSGRRYSTQTLTAAGLTTLIAHYPELEGGYDRLSARQAIEREAAEKEAAEQAKAEQEIADSAKRRKAARAASFREIMQQYQVRIDLTDDQCRAIWMAIVEREYDL